MSGSGDHIAAISQDETIDRGRATAITDERTGRSQWTS
jgi:hypothetical protein